MTVHHAPFVMIQEQRSRHTEPLFIRAQDSFTLALLRRVGRPHLDMSAIKHMHVRDDRQNTRAFVALQSILLVP